MYTSYVLTAALAFPGAVGHGVMTSPVARNANSMKDAGLCQDENGVFGSCEWFQEGCQPGCSECTFEKCYGFTAALNKEKCCDTVMEPTLNDPSLRTFQDDDPFWWWPLSLGHHKVSKYNPWRAPGFAPVADPCGLAGGGYKKPSPFAGPPPGHKMGESGLSLPERGEKVFWPAGSQQDVAWSVLANHGGGYAYRLCPKGAEDFGKESCFQRHHLAFSGNNSWIQYADDAANRTAIPASRVSRGTNPAGAEWTKNPIPACRGEQGGGVHAPGCSRTQFKAPMDEDGPWTSPGHAVFTKGTPGIFGFGPGRCAGGLCDQGEANFWKAKFNFNIIDKVEIPADLTPGDYVLSFRWDCEQTPQIWSSCADVTVTVPEHALV